MVGYHSRTTGARRRTEGAECLAREPHSVLVEILAAKVMMFQSRWQLELRYFSMPEALDTHSRLATFAKSISYAKEESRANLHNHPRPPFSPLEWHRQSDQNAGYFGDHQTRQHGPRK